MCHTIFSVHVTLFFQCVCQATRIVCVTPSLVCAHHTVFSVCVCVCQATRIVCVTPSLVCAHHTVCSACVRLLGLYVSHHL